MTRDELAKLLEYDPDTGAFRWKVNRRGTAKAGQEAGHINASGYRIIRTHKGRHGAHRLAFLLMTQGCSLLPDARIAQDPLKAQGIAIEGLSDVDLAIGAQQIEGEMAQRCKDTGIAPDATGVLGQGGIEDVVELVLDAPVAADGEGEVVGAGPGGAQVSGRCFGARGEGIAGGIEDLGGAGHLDEALEVIVPGRMTAAGVEEPHAHAALLDAIAPAQRGAVVRVAGGAPPDVLAHARQQPGLVGLELHQHVAARGDDQLDRVFCKCSASSVYRHPPSPSSSIRRWAAAIS